MASSHGSTRKITPIPESEFMIGQENRPTVNMRVNDWQMRLSVRIREEDVRYTLTGYCRLESMDLNNIYKG